MKSRRSLPNGLSWPETKPTWIFFWLKDESLDDLEKLPAPDVIAAEIVDNLEAALEQFRAMAEELEVE